jgi:hypothetical protein
MNEIPPAPLGPKPPPWRANRYTKQIPFAFDIETWTPTKLTYRNWFITLVIVLNIPLLSYDIYLSLGWLAKVREPAKAMAIWGLILSEALMVAFLVFVWFRYKWAAIGYLVLRCMQLTLILLFGLYLYAFHALIHIGIFILAIKSLWRPAFIPQHIKDKHHLP